MESLLMNGLITCLDHNYSDELLDNSSCVTPAFIFRAQKYVRDNVAQDIQPNDIANEVGVSRRRLFSGFKEYLDTTPMRYLRDLRLNQAHKDLLHSEKRHESVASIATNYGFRHLSHFGAAYKKKFGETPRETLNRYDNI